MIFRRLASLALAALLALAPAQAQQTFNATAGTRFSTAFFLDGTLTPAALAGDQNDYNPTNLATANALRIDGGGSNRNITGLAGGAAGRIIIIVNIGATNSLTLKNESASSAAANRFTGGSDIVIAAAQSMALRYDGTSSRWRQFTTWAATAAPTQQRLTSGTNATYTTPANARQLDIQCWGAGGGGGGGAGTSAAGTSGGSGGTTCFGTNATACTGPILSSNGGGGGTGGGQGGNLANGGAGGAAGGVSGTGDLQFVGFAGTASPPAPAGNAGSSGQGGGQGGGAGGGATTAGTVGAAPGGGGGGGGGAATAAIAAGAGGGSGAYTRHKINSPAVSYKYTIGAAGSAGALGTGGSPAAGGAGGPGYCVVDELY